jgi:hypothetical protein
MNPLILPYSVPCLGSGFEPKIHMGTIIMLKSLVVAVTARPDASKFPEFL